MPRFVGRAAPQGARQIENNAREIPGKRVRVTYSQMRLLRARDVLYSLDTTDKGGVRSFAKRWYRWFARPRAILDGASTPAMRERAHASLRAAFTL